MAVLAAPRTKPARQSPRLNASKRPLVMGIVNVTPDSFSDGGLFFDPQKAIEHGLALAGDGADILDIGGESTRPGAKPVSLDEELRRVIPVIESLSRQLRIPISIDTTKAEVARQAIAAGACIVNDISALSADKDMACVVAKSGAAVVLMHMRGTPQTMQRNPRYRDVVGEVAAYLKQRIAFALKAGIKPSRIWIDPGLGFGKTAAHNLELMRRLPELSQLKFPLLIGPSRKSFISAALNAPSGERLSGTLACLAWAYQCGVSVVRVHDVKPALDLFNMLGAIKEGS